MRDADKHYFPITTLLVDPGEPLPDFRVGGGLARFRGGPLLVNLYGAPFRMLSLEDGRKNVVLPQGQKIEVPPGAWRAVAFLGYGHDGKHPGAWTFHYSDGTAQAVDSQIPEWCTPPPDGFHVAFTAPYRYIANGPAGPPCELFLWSLPLDPSKTLTRIEFQQMKHAYIFAVTLLPAEFTQENNEITPTQKIKRKVINERYGAVIESMYAE